MDAPTEARPLGGARTVARADNNALQPDENQEEARSVKLDVHLKEKYRAVHAHVHEALMLTDASEKKLKNFRECGQWPVVIDFKGGGVQSVLVGQCRIRGCPYCANLLAAKRRERIWRVVEELHNKGAKFSLLTLTLRHCAQDNLEDLLRVLSRALRNLTQSRFFKRDVRGYARSIEITKRGSNGFHPHCHMIIQAGFLKLPELIACWKKCVRDAGGRDVEDQSVDLKGLTNPRKGLEEAIGYAFKAAELLEFSREEVVELLRVTREKHLSQCSRAWGRRAKQLEEEAEKADEDVRVNDGVERVSLVTVARGMYRGEVFSASAGLALCNFMVRQNLQGAGLTWLIDDLRVVRTVFGDSWRVAKAAQPGPAVQLVEAAGKLYSNKKPPCVLREEYNANRVPGKRRKKPVQDAQPA